MKDQFVRAAAAGALNASLLNGPRPLLMDLFRFLYGGPSADEAA
jgi:hypothetical protein